MIRFKGRSLGKSSLADVFGFNYPKGQEAMAFEG